MEHGSDTFCQFGSSSTSPFRASKRRTPCHDWHVAHTILSGFTVVILLLDVYSAGACLPLCGPLGWRIHAEAASDAMLDALCPQYLQILHHNSTTSQCPPLSGPMRRTRSAFTSAAIDTRTVSRVTPTAAASLSYVILPSPRKRK